LHNYERFAIGN